MKKLILSALFAGAAVIGLEAAPTEGDLSALIERLNRLEKQNQEQSARIKSLEEQLKANSARITDVTKRVGDVDAKAESNRKQAEGLAKLSPARGKCDEGTVTNETGRVYTTSNGKKYYLADATAGIFEPLSESGLQFTPYAYIVLEGVYSDRQLEGDYTTDWVSRNADSRNHTTLSVQDSIMGLQFMTPEAVCGWKFSGKAEFDLVDTSKCDQNHYGFHWRHLYVNAEHEASGWSILFGQTWHLWKMVSPSEIDGAWMENAGHPYRRSPQIRVTKKWDWEDSSLEARVGIVKGGPGMGEDRDSDGIQDNTASAWCLFEGALVYDHKAAWQDDDRRWLIGIGGMWGRDKSHRFGWTGGYTDDGDKVYGFGGGEDEYDSMMGMIAASVPIWNFTLCGQFYGGQNLGGVQAGCGQTVAYHNYDNGYVAGNAVRSIGGFVDLNYKINDSWSAAVGYGCDNPVDSDVEGGINNYDILFNDRVYVAAFYTITANFRLGLEYAHLLTTYGKNDDYSANGGVNDGDIGANRVQFSAFYDF